MNIYEQQSDNKRMTWLIVSAFVFFFLLIGFGFDVFVLGTRMGPSAQADLEYAAYNGHSRPAPLNRTGFPIGTAVALIAGAVMVFNSSSNGPRMVLQSSGAFPADPNNPKHRQFLNVLEEMHIASGLPMPKAFVIPDPDPNAFATGFSPDNSYVAVTEGLLDSLNREELQGVVAHEMSHIRNLDIRLMTMVAALAGAILLISDFALRMGGMRRGSSRDGGGKGNALGLILWLVVLILAPLITNLMAMAISRRREYLADASAAELTRNPMGLASALEKIRSASSPTRSIRQGVAHMCIEDPRGAAAEDGSGFFADLFSTHPPVAKRIEALRAMAYIK
ncbi:MAG: M48 family metallopeptidase [Elusimicrobia bacterium]|nr:M48 family metallopeptidase [Elusimicrobiota bacterium]